MSMFVASFAVILLFMVVMILVQAFTAKRRGQGKIAPGCGRARCSGIDRCTKLSEESEREHIPESP